MHSRSSRKIVWTSLLCGLLWLAPGVAAHAEVHMTAQQVVTPTMTLTQLDASLEPGEQGRLHVVLKVGRVDMAAAGWRRVGLAFDGTATRIGNQDWQLDGKLQLRGAPGGLMSNSQIHVVIDGAANNLDVGIAQGKTKVDVALPLDQLTHARIRLQHLPLKWLRGLLVQVWSGKLTGGHMDGTVALDVADRGLHLSGNFSLGQASFDSSGGALAGENLNVSGRATLDTTGKQGHSNVDINLKGGQLLLGSLYAALPKHAVHLALRTTAQPHGIAFPQLRFTDPGALHLAGSMVLSAQGGVRNLHFTQFDADLARAYPRYGKAWLATLGLADLHVKGNLDGSVWLDSHGLRAFRLQAKQVDVVGDHLATHGLDGGLDWQRGGNRPATTLSWQKLEFYKVALGAASGRWQTRAGKLTLDKPLDVPVLGGQLHLQRLAWNPQSDGNEHLQTALAVTGVDVAKLCDALGWPKFTGTLAGSIPGLQYVDNRVDLDGGLSLSVFGGFVDMTSLSLEHPFGDVPVLAADVHLRHLDMENLTGVFDFGRITGRMNGDIEGLRMVDWKPVAFKAALETEGDGGRISQRAVNNLTSVGGGGMASGLQGAVLKLFKSFGYRKIGLHCTLQGSVCHMGGLEPADDGYLIVQGRGLPHLSVVGHQKNVSWPVLIKRLTAAIDSGGPVIK